jgi:SAM-dependent methyltransferase
MSPNQRSDETIAYYERHATAYVAGTLNVCMEMLYQPFLKWIPTKGHILDVGCGSGRDSREFKKWGYTVTAIDASPTLARLAGEIIGQPVGVMRIQELTYEEAFDGVWACASLLHVARTEMDEAIARLTQALRPAGVAYASFKLGEGELIQGGRLYNNYTEESLGELLHRHPRLEFLSVWRTEDRRPANGEQLWLNVLVQKVGR